ncbi:hydrogenase expression/formation protein HypE [Pontiellaceae bacterium B12227]|nr:hydrogenase expression/formation protein HypE [Pontiellaceae bacterium B12227]
MIKTITMAHGSGRGLSDLLETVVLPNLLAEQGSVLEDAAVFQTLEGRLAFTTDSFVVQPLEFSGGDIGKLAACGTINDLAVMGAVPSHMSVSLILEEGLEVALLERVLNSLRDVCISCGVNICCGDTKVIDRGSGDGLYMNTSGVGRVAEGLALSAANARPGDAVIVSGDIARHGVAILSQRQNLGFESQVESDCAPLDELCAALLKAVPDTRVMRDATRGGCAAVLNEIAAASGVSIKLDGSAIPVTEAVKQACAFLGMDPLQVANEGTFFAVVPRASVAEARAAIGGGSAVIGTVGEASRFPVTISTEIGGTRPVENPPGELLPRIC